MKLGTLESGYLASGFYELPEKDCPKKLPERLEFD
jgi:hypothetical protein